MQVSFLLCDIRSADETTFLFSRVRFVYRAGTAAVWNEDPDTDTHERLAYLTGTVYNRRRTARQPATLTLEDGTVWNIWPVRNAGCGSCGGNRGRFSIDQLLAPPIPA